MLAEPQTPPAELPVELPAVLVIDDEPANLLATAALLWALPARVVTAPSGTAALHALLQTDFAVILLDVRMPDMDGFETAEIIRMRDRSAHVPIIFLTAHSRTEEAIQRSCELGAVDYITKPLVPEVLRAKVSVFLDLHGKSMEVRRQGEILRISEARESQRRLEEVAVNERRRSEDELRHVHARQAFLMASAPFAIYAAEYPAFGRTTSITPNIMRVTGFSAESFLERADLWSSRIHPECRERVERDFEALERGERVNAEYRWRCADGTYRWFLDQATVIHDASGAPTEVVGTFLDIHDRKLAETALASAYAAAKHAIAERALEEYRVKVTLHSIDDGVITTDIEGRVRLMSRVAEQLTGWTQAEAIGLPIASVYVVNDERTAARLQPLCPRARKDHEVTGRLDRRDGGGCAVEWSASDIQDQSGERLGSVMVFRDITTRRRHMEDMLKASKLESITVLAGGIAHDFNNLLTGIMASVSTAMLQTRRGQDPSERLQAAQMACERARDLTRQLLTFARRSEPVKEPLALDRLVRTCTAFALQGSRSRCELAIEERLWAVEGDANQLSQVIQNLVINADQAMAGGGVLSVEVRNVALAGGPPGLPPGRYVSISVSDSGEGIPPEHLAKVFDPFFTTKEGGTGLGLATADAVARGHGGRLEVASERGRGSTFTMLLPAMGDGAFEEGPPDDEAFHDIVPVGPGRGRVLVVDDEAPVREVAKSALEALGFDVEVAADGEEAVAIFAREHGAGLPFSVVIVDLTIPGGAGSPVVLSQLRTIDASVRAVVSSGYTSHPVLDAPAVYGFQAVLTKPWTIQILDTLMRTLLPDD